MTMPERSILPLEYKFYYTTHAYASCKIKIEVNGRELPNSPISGEEVYDPDTGKAGEKMYNIELGSLIFDEYEQGIEIKLTFVEKHIIKGLRWSGATNKNYSIIYNFTMEPVIQ